MVKKTDPGIIIANYNSIWIIDLKTLSKFYLTI